MTADEPNLAGKSAPTMGKRGNSSVQKIVDSQTVKTTEVAQEVGYDGGKLVKGYKRLLVDTLGLLLQVVVSAAKGARESWSEAAIGKDKGSIPSTKKDFRGWGL